MLTNLQIENVAIIKEAVIDFRREDLKRAYQDRL